MESAALGRGATQAIIHVMPSEALATGESAVREHGASITHAWQSEAIAIGEAVARRQHATTLTANAMRFATTQQPLVPA